MHVLGKQVHWIEKTLTKNLNWNLFWNSEWVICNGLSCCIVFFLCRKCPVGYYLEAKKYTLTVLHWSRRNKQNVLFIFLISFLQWKILAIRGSFSSTNAFWQMVVLEVGAVLSDFFKPEAFFFDWLHCWGLKCCYEEKFFSRSLSIPI